MKKIFTTMLICIAIFATQAVSASGFGHAGKTLLSHRSVSQILGHSNTSGARAATCDTLLNLDFSTADSNGVIFGWQAPSVGYVSGNGALNFGAATNYPIAGVAERFTTPIAGEHVNGALVVFGKLKLNPTHADSILKVTAYVYDTTGAGAVGTYGPGNALDSASLTIASIITAQGNAVFTFTHSVTLPSKGFFIAVALPRVTGDTLVIVTNDGTTGNGQGWINIPTAGGWAPYDSITGSPLGTYTIAFTCGSASSACPTAVSISEATQGTLTANITGGSGPFTYNWHIYNSTGQNYNATTATVSNVPANMSATVTVTAVGCAPVTSSVFQSTTPTNCATNYSSTTTTLLSGAIVARATGGTGGRFFYYFDFGTSNQASYNDTFTPIGATSGQSYQLIVIDVNGCVYATTNTYTLPTSCPTITVSATQIGSTTSAYATATGGAAPYTYRWSNNQTTDTISGLTVGTSYVVTVSDRNGCTGTGSVTIAPAGCPTITATATQIGTTGSAYASATGGAAPYTYRWSTTPVQTTDTAIGLVTGSYTVTVSDRNGCTAAATVTIRPNGIENINGVTSFSVYPNPSNGVFTATASFASAADVTISIVDMTGSKVYESSDKAVKEITKPINLSSVAAGVYIINVKTNNGTANQRIIIK